MIVAIGNKKGGVGKTTTAINLGVALRRKGERVCLIDLDPQGNLTTGLGLRKNLSKTIKTVMEYIVMRTEYAPEEVILTTPEGVDLVPANAILSAMEMFLVTADDREYVLKMYTERIRDAYDFIILDCGPALGPLMVNALTAADRIVIPVETQPYGTEGLQDMLGAVSQTRKRLNPNLQISILYAIDDPQTRQSQSIRGEIEAAYGAHLHILKHSIPRRAAISAAPGYGVSFFRYVEEVERKRRKELQPILQTYLALADEMIQLQQGGGAHEHEDAVV